MKVGMNKCSEANSSSTALLDSLPILTLALQFRATPAGEEAAAAAGLRRKISCLDLCEIQPLESVQHLPNCSALCADCSRPASALIHNGTSCLPYRSVHHSQTYMFRANLRQRRIFTKVPLAHIVGFLTRPCVNSCFPLFQPGHLSDPTLLPRRLYSASPAS